MVFHGSVPPETLMRRERAEFAGKAGRTEKTVDRGTGWAPWAYANLQTLNFRSLPDQGLNHGAGAKLWWSRN